MLALTFPQIIKKKQQKKCQNALLAIPFCLLLLISAFCGKKRPHTTPAPQEFSEANRSGYSGGNLLERRVFTYFHCIYVIRDHTKPLWRFFYINIAQCKINLCLACMCVLVDTENKISWRVLDFVVISLKIS